MTVLIRPATPADASAIAHIHVETWRAAYRGLMPDAVLDALDVERRAAFWQDRLAQPWGSVWVAEDDSLAGFCDLIPSRDQDAAPDEVAEIVAIYVLPAHWGQGVGRALCEQALAQARQRGCRAVTLWVLASNHNAMRFYEAMGFALDGAQKTKTVANGVEVEEVRYRLAL